MSPVEIGLSFAEGLALIASPCILPVLPLVLGASVEGGKKRPFGIITGFVLAFTAFALLSRKLVSAFGINLDAIKYGSLILLALFALVLLSETLSAKFSALTQRFANAGGNVSAGAQDGFLSGIVIGMLIGLVWTPCAGPILAAVLVQIIRQESDLAALFLVAAFALGAGVPMLIISLTGRKFIARMGFLTTHAETIRKGFGIVILLAVLFIASGIDPQSFFSKSEVKVADAHGLQDALAKPYPAPEFAGIETWVGSQPLTMASLRGKVVLIDFWTYSCINCVRTLPYITQWDRDYRDKGLVIVGVHAPEFEFEKNADNVRAAVKAYHIDYPVALDNRLDTWTAFHNNYWPAHYLIDKSGNIVYTHFGEGNYSETENNIRYLLGLQAKNEAPESQTFTMSQTPETYLGMQRAARFSSPEPLAADTDTFSFPESLPADHWALSGDWAIQDQRITAKENVAKLRLHFTAAKVFLVLGTNTEKSLTAMITLNGAAPGNAAGKDAPGGKITVMQHTLYELINQNSVKSGELEITVPAGLEAYAFTFGN